MARETDACVQPATGPIGAPAPEQSEAVGKERVAVAMARVGMEAPDFEASGFIAGEGFKNVRLSSYRGQWVLLCFYPGDFTFV